MEIPQFVEKALGFSQIEEADFSVSANQLKIHRKSRL
jgi:hypothetical protein